MIDYGKHHAINTYEKGKIIATKQYYEIPVPTSQADVLKDILDALRPLTSNKTSKVELEIVVSKAGNWLLKKKWSEG